MPRKLQEKADAYIWGYVYIYLYLQFSNSKMFIGKIFLLKQLFKNFLSVFLSLCIKLRK